MWKNQHKFQALTSKSDPHTVEKTTSDVCQILGLEGFCKMTVHLSVLQLNTVEKVGVTESLDLKINVSLQFSSIFGPG